MKIEGDPFFFGAREFIHFQMSLNKNDNEDFAYRERSF